jgi:hypothetical protein
LEYVIAIALLCALAWFVGGPLLRSAEDVEEHEGGEDPELADLEAAKEAKYRQIREAELDRAAGKLSQADWERADGELRRDAIEILKRLDALERKAGTKA